MTIPGQFSMTFNKGEKETHNHDKKWKTKASGGWGFWKAKASASQEKHFRQSLGNLVNVKISCDFMGEYWVNRRNWFSSPILSNPYVQEVLKNDPASTALLANVVSSMIIVRGLKVSYIFKTVEDTKIWSSYAYGASGGFKVFGIGASLGGSSSGSKLDAKVYEKEKTVTFSDGEDVCRLLAMRVSQNLDIPEDQVAFLTNLLEDTVLGQSVIKEWEKGTLPPGEYPDELDKVGFWND